MRVGREVDGKDSVMWTPGVCGGGELRAAIYMARRSQPVSIKGKHVCDFKEREQCWGER